MKNTFVLASNWAYGRKAIEVGLPILASSGSALDAVERGICAVEDDPSVDSVGTGGLPNFEGVGELDASIMVGNTYRSGAVTGLTYTRNPISVARKVMELSPHNMLSGLGAQRFARAVGFPEYEPVTPEARRKWTDLRKKLSRILETPSVERDINATLGYDAHFGALAKGVEILSRQGELHLTGTVGLLAMDQEGTIVAGTSTSGWALRLPGRVADSSVIGAGTYACPAGAATSTGMGEYSIRHNLTRGVCLRLEQGLSPTEACEETLRDMLRREDVDVLLALIAIDRRGRVGGATTKAPFSYQYYSPEHLKIVEVTPSPLREGR
jgi:isoaspartyl peptidase/L-asparaginase-like protein (Ntn-hydrolase superfamily)